MLKEYVVFHSSSDIVLPENKPQLTLIEHTISKNNILLEIFKNSKKRN